MQQQQDIHAGAAEKRNQAVEKLSFLNGHLADLSNQLQQALQDGEPQPDIDFVSDKPPSVLGELVVRVRRMFSHPRE